MKALGMDTEPMCKKNRQRHGRFRPRMAVRGVRVDVLVERRGLREGSD
jgi:hypothetical protein